MGTASVQQSEFVKYRGGGGGGGGRRSTIPPKAPFPNVALAWADNGGEMPGSMPFYAVTVAFHVNSYSFRTILSRKLKRTSLVGLPMLVWSQLARLEVRVRFPMEAEFFSSVNEMLLHTACHIQYYSPSSHPLPPRQLIMSKILLEGP